MPKKKTYDDKDGAKQKAARAKAIAAAAGVVVETGGKVRRKHRMNNDISGAAKLDSRAAWH